MTHSDPLFVPSSCRGQKKCFKHPQVIRPTNKSFAMDHKSCQGPSDQWANCIESWATERPGLRRSSHSPVAVVKDRLINLPGRMV